MTGDSSAPAHAEQGRVVLLAPVFIAIGQGLALLARPPELAGPRELIESEAARTHQAQGSDILSLAVSPQSRASSVTVVAASTTRMTVSANAIAVVTAATN
eukprot:6175285-Pleurochrysis_carterae.AAC.1